MAELVDLPKKKGKKSNISKIIDEHISNIKDVITGADIDRMVQPWKDVQNKLNNAEFHLEKFCIDSKNQKTEFIDLMNKLNKNPEKYLEVTTKDFFNKDGLYFVVVKYYEVKDEKDKND